MPANTVDIKEFFLFLFKTAKDPRFTVSNVMSHVEKVNPKMGFFDRVVYRLLIYIYRRKVRCLEQEFNFLEGHARIWPGPSRDVDALQRTLLVPALPVSAPGITDFPSIWNQKLREDLKLHLHWDGNNPVLLERNLVAASGVVGRDLKALDLPRLQRITEYIMDLQPPKYEEMIPDDKYKINPEA